MLATIKKGFTLIELLVVITIIGILATGAVTVYTGQITKARDSTRITDLKAIEGALALVNQDLYEYPAKSDVMTEIAKFIQKIPSDPKNGKECTKSNSGSEVSICGYVYNRSSMDGVDGAGYEISTAFETKKALNNSANNSVDYGDDENRMEIIYGDNANTIWRGSNPAEGKNISQ